MGCVKGKQKDTHLFQGLPLTKPTHSRPERRKVPRISFPENLPHAFQCTSSGTFEKRGFTANRRGLPAVHDGLVFHVLQGSSNCRCLASRVAGLCLNTSDSLVNSVVHA